VLLILQLSLFDSRSVLLASLSAFVLGLGLCWGLSAAHAGGEENVLWEDLHSEHGNLRRATFPVTDPVCAYSVMAQPVTMGRLVRHVKKLVVHRIEANFQDISIHERFFLVGNVESRYHRQVNGSDRVEWQLTVGRQARHDGFWQVERLPGGGHQVVFENLLAAQYSLHQGLLRRIQERTMTDIVEAMSAACSESGSERGKWREREPLAQTHDSQVEDKPPAEPRSRAGEAAVIQSR